MSLSCRSVVVAACCHYHYHRGEKKVSQQYYIFFLNITFVWISCGLKYLHWIILKYPLTIFLLKIRQSMNITSKVVPLGNILTDKWVIGNINFFFYVLQQFLMFLVPTMQESEIHVVSNTHFRQYQFSILWQEFLGISDVALLC